MESFLSAPLINCFKFYWSTFQKEGDIKLGRLIRVCEEDLIMWLEQKKNYLLKNVKSKM